MGDILARNRRAGATTLVGDSEDYAAEVTQNKDLQTDEGIRETAISKLMTIDKITPVPVRVNAGNLVGRKSILVQPLDGDIKFGYDNVTLVHEVTKGNFLELKVTDAIDVYIISKNTTNCNVAISEFK